LLCVFFCLGFQHVEVPIPSPKKGEVLVRMEATSINQVDWKFQKGVARARHAQEVPLHLR
jgi:NADPH:quinone reductase-like Zn-dependent oxidoreductase